MTLDLVRPILTYIRAYYIEAPLEILNYFHHFGELDYDLLSIRTERQMMTSRLQGVQRLVESNVPVNDRSLHHTLVTAKALARERQTKLARLKERITAAEQFHYNPVSEEQGFYLLADIISAIMGVDDPEHRKREQETFLMACEAYGRQDITELTDIHESVQEFLSFPRRDSLEKEELKRWNAKLRRLYRQYPLLHADALESNESIAKRTALIKGRIAREMVALERTAMAYIATLHTTRNRN